MLTRINKSLFPNLFTAKDLQNNKSIPTKKLQIVGLSLFFYIFVGDRMWLGKAKKIDNFNFIFFIAPASYYLGI